MAGIWIVLAGCDSGVRDFIPKIEVKPKAGEIDHTSLPSYDRPDDDAPEVALKRATRILADRQKRAEAARAKPGHSTADGLCRQWLATAAFADAPTQAGSGHELAGARTLMALADLYRQGRLERGAIEPLLNEPCRLKLSDGTLAAYPASESVGRFVQQFPDARLGCPFSMRWLWEETQQRLTEGPPWDSAAPQPETAAELQPLLDARQQRRAQARSEIDMAASSASHDRLDRMLEAYHAATPAAQADTASELLGLQVLAELMDRFDRQQFGRASIREVLDKARPSAAGSADAHALEARQAAEGFASWYGQCTFGRDYDLAWLWKETRLRLLEADASSADSPAVDVVVSDVPLAVPPLVADLDVAAVVVDIPLPDDAPPRDRQRLRVDRFRQFHPGLRVEPRSHTVARGETMRLVLVPGRPGVEADFTFDAIEPQIKLAFFAVNERGQRHELTRSAIADALDRTLAEMNVEWRASLGNPARLQQIYREIEAVRSSKLLTGPKQARIRELDAERARCEPDPTRFELYRRLLGQYLNLSGLAMLADELHQRATVHYSVIVEAEPEPIELARTQPAERMTGVELWNTLSPHGAAQHDKLAAARAVVRLQHMAAAAVRASVGALPPEDQTETEVTPSPTATVGLVAAVTAAAAQFLSDDARPAVDGALQSAWKQLLAEHPEQARQIEEVRAAAALAAAEVVDEPTDPRLLAARAFYRAAVAGE